MADEAGGAAERDDRADADERTGTEAERGTLEGTDDRFATSASRDVDPAILRLSPAEREARGITDDEVRETFRSVLVYGSEEQKELEGVTLPELSLDRTTLESVDRHPVDLSGATIEGLSLGHARVTVPLVLDEATIGSLRLRQTHVEAPVSCSNATVTGETTLFEARFDDDVSFDGTTFEGPVDCDEATFRDDVRFDDATFDDDVTFRAAECHGDSNHLEDNTTFSEATFRADVTFRETEFGFTRFDDVTCHENAVFREATFTGDADFRGVEFGADADFDEVRFEDDTAFDDAAFRGRTTFRGGTFAGGARTLIDDASFVGATFHGDVTFRRASFRYVTFEAAAFRAVARFESTAFAGDADFPDVSFDRGVDFDEGRFREDADFSGVRFDGPSTFRGCEFLGGANHLKDDVSFEGARFADDVDFHDAEIASANFQETAFGGTVDCSRCVVSERIDIEAHGIDDDVFVDFTRAKIRSGRIVQPAEGWVRYDLTLASIGDVDLAAERTRDHRQLLDYFRFCRTEFDEFDGHTFDFSGHRGYLDRNDWTIHGFDQPPADGVDRDYALEMTPEVVESTYLKAKQSAGEIGDMKTAGEFRVKRQRYSRHKNLEAVRDRNAGLMTRTKNLGRAVENWFLGITCGHGMRPMRIGIMFAIAPLFFAIPYAFGGSPFETGAGQLSIGDLATADGLGVFYENVYFSYVSYTTIGYGNIAPEGPLARLLAGSEAYLSTILAALLVYALVKRSEL
ncbi:pentapeptide repeat-containing protein [Natrinema salaciae]|uniref:Pentapeptide repeat-containing protein n=1 Tax=Natrinema salaciae TaxID=1186196 RepID=A0A1H9JE51_9EURY|nr:potassium channel family protein [Natrinema salaciae]SEQ85106.1 Pentapeptide repeat-containing protein [Natrinema salaciae]